MGAPGATTGRLAAAARAAFRSRTGRGVLVAALVAGAAVARWDGVLAAFSATTTNPGNSMTLGTVVISDNDAGAAMLSVTGMLPGGTGSGCVVVTYSGTAPATVKLYAANAAGGDGAADGVVIQNWLRFHIQVGTGTCGAPVGLTNVSAAAPGDLATAVYTRSNFGNGYGTGWTSATSGNTRVFRFTYTADAATPNTAQGDSITTDFVWEAQNN
ncbi:hypothetical protein GCM10010123_25330 [Pilimelia anulata]|uniref:Uncharacterized protein n=1 Tax=Pilimelia anulata TaxID=53371 RepID=A0A8J3BBH2_9ACTN|nr:hypothetical protein [Pilimelia anulata]GGJ94413.1 hypothetical protein GCM10010123_25330 [Pilimelia anulata]